MAQRLLAAGLDIEQVDAGARRTQRHEGDLLAVGGEPRRKHHVRAIGQVARISPVLVHDRQAADALELRPALGDEHHAGVEIALLAGELFIDRVGDLVRQAPPVLRRGRELQAQQLLAGIDVPQPEIHAQPALAVVGHLAGDQGLGADRLPLVELRLQVHVDLFLQEGVRIQRLEQARALQVRGHHLRDLSADGRAAERRDGDRQGLGHALVDVDHDVRARGDGRSQHQAGEDRQKGQQERLGPQHLGSPSHSHRLCLRRT